jgi:hypothetical protein
MLCHINLQGCSKVTPHCDIKYPILLLFCVYIAGQILEFTKVAETNIAKKKK